MLDLLMVLEEAMPSTAASIVPASLHSLDLFELVARPEKHSFAGCDAIFAGQMLKPLIIRL